MEKNIIIKEYHHSSLFHALTTTAVTDLIRRRTVSVQRVGDLPSPLALGILPKRTCFSGFPLFLFVTCPKFGRNLPLCRLWNF